MFSTIVNSDDRPTPDERHICKAVRLRLPGLERLYLRTHCLCPAIFRPMPGREQVDLANRLWPNDQMTHESLYDQALERHGSEFTNRDHDRKDDVEKLLRLYRKDDREDDGHDGCENDLPPEPTLELKEIVINMVLPPFQRWLHRSVVHCVSGDFPLTVAAEEVYADLAVESMKAELTRFKKRLVDPLHVVLRYKSTDENMANEWNALTDKTRQLPITMYGDVIGGDTSFDA